MSLPSKKSFHGQGYGTPAYSANSAWKKLLLDTHEDDEEVNIKDFEDVKCEIQATGHHLVSFPQIFFSCSSIIFLLRPQEEKILNNLFLFISFSYFIGV